MNEEIKNKKESLPEQLIEAKSLYDDCKFDEALLLVDELEAKENLTASDKVSCYILKSELLYQLMKNEDAFKYAEQAFLENQALNNNLQSIDALLAMALTLFFRNMDKIRDLIAQIEDLFPSINQKPQLELKKRVAALNLVKGHYYHYGEQDSDKALSCFKRSLAIQEELGNKSGIIISLAMLSQLHSLLIGDLDRALMYAERCQTLAEELNDKQIIALNLTNLAVIYGHKGEIERSLTYHKRSLAIFEENDAQAAVASVLNNIGGSYQQLGELDRAIEYLERSLALSEKLEYDFFRSATLDTIISVYLDKGDIERAQQCLQQMSQLTHDETYRLNKALILKKSSRTRDRAEAEDMLKKLLEEEKINFELTIKVLINLCELLLDELRMTSDLEVLNDIKPYITRLLEVAERSKSHWILAETYLLKAKLSLLTFDMKKARRYLTQAQKVAERHGLNRLVTKITGEHEKLLKQLKMWEKLKESNAHITERLELAQLGEQVERMARNRAVVAQITEEKVTVHKERKICLVCKGEIVGFMYVCDCDTIYCENCTRALAELENICWVCNAPLDDTKPVKPYNGVDKKRHIKISGNGQKKLKK